MDQGGYDWMFYGVKHGIKWINYVVFMIFSYISIVNLDSLLEVIYMYTYIHTYIFTKTFLGQ